jgi:eukaryotic-like serine/threonine-protein kinase
MSERPKCPKCGGELPADAPGDLCPNCLLATGLKSQSAEDPYAEYLASTAPQGDDSEGSATAVQLEPGQQFGGYRIIRRLGRGGMGAVYEAEDLESHRRVALKILAHSFDSPDARKRFLREGRLAASINHPNSVYVYGTEEIEGTPAISMELVPGGTLERRVRHEGPLPIAEAVDAILEIVSGLEAAQSVGVLHRDVKPANCFLDPDGMVKVGDFGLSISTAPRGESNISLEGTFLGTPAYASPEQLRGDELDVRADVYSVGVTLYYLLTGRAPFENRNLVQFLATVLERPAPSPRTIRGEIPKELARIVLRCLEKQPASRYATYDELRRALLPYSSTAPTAATLGLRVVASVVDGLIWSSVVVAFCLAWFRDPAAIFFPDLSDHDILMTFPIVNGILLMLYYALPEGLWGATPGKALCRLRVVDSSKSAPGISKAFVRALIWILFPVTIYVPYLIYAQPTFAVGEVDWVTQVMAWSYYVLLVVLFSTARRRNGYAGIHDLATGLRVVARSSFQPRPVSHTQDELLPDTQSMPKIGPYYVLDHLHQGDDAESCAGYDVRLLRKVWIRRTAQSTPPVAQAIRNLARAGRVRWLGGKRDSEESWDAYEFLSGRPLAHLLDRPQPWQLVRYWLADLSEELNAALKDNSLPEILSLDRVWITSDNRAKLLDFNAPGIERPVQPVESGNDVNDDFIRARRFLNQVAMAALEAGCVSSSDADERRVAAPVPLHARAVLDQLPVCTGPALPAHAFKPMLQKVACVSRVRRVALVLGSLVLPAFFGATVVLAYLMNSQWLQQHPEVATLRHCLIKLDSLQRKKSPSAEEMQTQRDLEVYIASELSDAVDDDKAMTGAAVRGVIVPQWRAIADKAVAARANVSDTDAAEAARRLRAFLDKCPSGLAAMFPNTNAPFFVFFVFFMIGVSLACVILPSLVLAFVCRGGFLIHTLGIAIVTERGVRATRLRTFWRSLISWSPLLLLPILVILLKPFIREQVSFSGLLCLLLAALTVLVALSCLLPNRSLQDRLAGTYLVPR